MFFPEERAAGVWHESSSGQVNVARQGDVAANHTIAHHPVIYTLGFIS